MAVCGSSMQRRSSRCNSCRCLVDTGYWSFSGEIVASCTSALATVGKKVVVVSLTPTLGVSAGRSLPKCTSALATVGKKVVVVSLTPTLGVVAGARLFLHEHQLSEVAEVVAVVESHTHAIASVVACVWFYYDHYTNFCFVFLSPQQGGVNPCNVG